MVPRFTKRVKFLIATGVSVAGLLAVLLIPGMRPRDFLAAHWQSQLSTLPDEQLVPLLRSLVDLGDDQLDFVVQKVGSEQDRISRAARQVIAEQLPRWRLLSTDESAPKVARLARVMAQQVAMYRGESKSFASDLATKMLVWPASREQIDTIQLITHCETILREAGRRDLRVAKQESQTVPEQPRGERSPVPKNLGADAAIDSELAQQLAGNSPLDTSVSLPSTIPIVEPTLPPLAEQRRPARLSIGDRPTESPPEVASVSQPVAEPPRVVTSATVWRQRTTLDVMKRLQSNDVVEASQAMEEFRRRGFGENHLRLVEQLVSPVPQVRRQLAQSLPRFSNLDARPWLIWLSQDDDPEVRLAAVALMAANNDMEIRKRLRQMELEESSSAVLRQVQRSLR